MKSTTKIISLILLLTFLFTSCQTAQTETPTPESAAMDVSGVDQPTEDPESDKPAQKPSTEVESVSQCSDFLWSALGFDVTYQLLADNVDGNGNCEASSSVNAVMAGDVNTVIDTVEPTLFAQDFQLDESFAADGPLAVARGYRVGNEFCIVTVAGGPAEESLCPEDEPIDACWERLNPQQQLLTTTLTCTTDLETALPKTEPERIAFEPGATSAILAGMIEAKGLVPYVFSAAQGQETTINLATNATRSTAVVLEIWGLDGTTFLVESDQATSWHGFLPATQDYTIDLLSSSDHSVQYELELIILPASESTVLPETTPVEFESVYGFTSPELPIMLPTEFDNDPKMPIVVPFVMAAEETYFEIILDYGNDCHGAGACHYGVLAAIINPTDSPLDTPSIIFDAENAEAITLDRNIPAWFVPSQCGANCSDALIFYIFDGVQTIIGTRNPDKADLIALANEMIANSIH